MICYRYLYWVRFLKMLLVRGIFICVIVKYIIWGSSLKLLKFMNRLKCFFKVVVGDLLE